MDFISLHSYVVLDVLGLGGGSVHCENSTVSTVCILHYE